MRRYLHRITASPRFLATLCAGTLLTAAPSPAIAATPALEATAQVKSALPVIPVEVSNPYWQRLLLEFERLNEELQQADTRDTTFRNGLHIRETFRDMDFLVWAYYAEQSPLYKDPRLLERMTEWTQTHLDLASRGSYVSMDERPDHNMDRFILAKLGQAWLWWKAADPEIAATELGQNVNKLLDEGARLQIARYGKPGVQPYGPTWYPNIDATWVLQMWAAAEATGTPQWKKLANERIDSLERNMFADGAWTYLAYTNAEPAYQGVAVRQVARYYLLSGDPRIENMAKKLAPYYPLSIQRGGVSEGSTSPHWKHRWDAIKPNEPDLIASIANDPANAAVAKSLHEDYLAADVPWHRTDLLLSALLYKEFDLEGVEPFRNGIVIDRNIEGPRGRFGNWSFAASGRDWKDDRGKMSFVGLMQLDEADGAYPLSGALETAGFEITSKGKRYELTMDESSEWVLGDDWASFVATYKHQQPISGGGRSYAVPWAGSQLWLMTEKRAVGLLQVWQDGSISADKIEGLLRIGNGRGLPLRNRRPGQLLQNSESEWSYGDLNIKLHAMSFDSVSSQVDSAYRGKPTAMRLAHSVAVKDQPKANAAWYYLVEIYPKTSAPATEVSCQFSNAGLVTLKVKDENRFWTLTANPNRAGITVNTSQAGGQYFVGSRQDSSSITKPLSSSSHRIGKGSHIVRVE